MTQEQLTPEQARSKAEDMALEAGNLDFYTNHHYRDHVQELFFKAITQATEPLQREIERSTTAFNELLDYTTVKQQLRIKQLESDNALLVAQSIEQELLVERLRSALESVAPHHGSAISWGENKIHPGRIIDNALKLSPQPTIGVKAFELAKAGAFFMAEFNRDRGGMSFYDLNDPNNAFDKLAQAAASFTQDELKILGG